MNRKLDPDKREAFLNAALELFAANGVQNTSTAMITEKAGTAAGTLFLYFPTKQDLINELVLKISEEQSQYIRSLLDPSLSVRDTFQAIWRGSMQWFLDNRQAYRYNQQVRDSGIISEAVVLQSAQYLDYYFTAIQKGLQQNRIKPYPLNLIGAFLYHDIVAVIDTILAQDGASKQEDIIQDGFDIFWNGIRTDRRNEQ